MLTEKIAQLSRRRIIYLIALALGLVQSFVFDFSFNSAFRWLAPVFSYISLMGFVTILQHLNPKRAILFAYLFGFSAFAWGLNWVYISMANYGHAPLVFAVLANVLIIAYLAIYWGLAGLLMTYLGKTINQRLLLAAPIIALLEWLRSVVLTGFPWLSVGYGWVDTPVSHLASFGGVFFVTFVVLILVAFPLLQLRRLHKNVLLINVVGLVAIFSIPFSPLKESGQLNVTLIQGNMPVITSRNTKRMLKNLVVYEGLMEKALEQYPKTELVIWPESSVPFLYNDSRELLMRIDEKQTQQKFDFVSGFPYAEVKTQQFYNSIFLQKKAHGLRQTQRYDKQHLLPFGEYLPLRSLFAFFEDFVTIHMAEFTPGKTIQTNFISHGLAIAPTICFEAVFGDEVGRNTQQAQILLNISNDAWFGKSKSQAQHLNIVRMRAIENQKMLVRATNNGLTAVVSPSGKVVKSLPPYEKGILNATVTAYDNKTLYTQFGDMPWVILFLIFGISVYVLGWRSERVATLAKNR